LPDDLDGGIFSGGAFVDDDGTCYMTYWGLPVEGENHGGVRIIKSSDRHYDVWEKFDEYALACTESGVHQTVDADGNDMFLGCADPSNIWKKDDKYYMQMGCLSVLLKFKRDGIRNYTEEELAEIDVPANIVGDWVDLFVSDDLVDWKYLHRFYERDQSNKWTQSDEDDMCPSFLPLPLSKNGGELSDKYLQLFISHNKGCQYYIGNYDKENDLLNLESHGRMSWVDNTFFAPEALMDKNNRQIMWSWLLDNLPDELENGWSGVYCLPRTLWLTSDNTLGIAPIDEIKMLRYNSVEVGKVTMDNRRIKLDDINGESCEICLELDVAGSDKTGVIVRANDGLTEFTKLYYDKKTQKLVFDATHSGMHSTAIESAPFVLKEGEKLKLDIFIDKSIIEIFANDRQAICRRVYPVDESSDNVYLYASGKATGEVTYYEMMPSNFC
jgi:beta-fructofuranosidase